MKLSDPVFQLLTEYAARPLASKMQIHPDASPIYELGLKDGITILSAELLLQLKPDVVVPENLKESE